MICERKLAGGIGVDTAAATLALAEQHGCSVLKARCVEFIVGSPGRLDAVLATEGYKHLAASCPLVLAELLKAARGRKSWGQSMDYGSGSSMLQDLLPHFYLLVLLVYLSCGFFPWTIVHLYLIIWFIVAYFAIII